MRRLARVTSLDWSLSLWRVELEAGVLRVDLLKVLLHSTVICVIVMNVRMAITADLHARPYGSTCSACWGTLESCVSSA